MKFIKILFASMLIPLLSFSQGETTKNYPKDWALVEVNGLYGFIDSEGNEVVKPKYHVIHSFGEYQNDWALVEINGLYGFIDSEGNEAVKPKYNKISSFGEYQKDWALVEKKEYYGFIDSEGNEVVKPKYHSIDLAVFNSPE